MGPLPHRPRADGRAIRKTAMIRLAAAFMLAVTEN